MTTTPQERLALGVVALLIAAGTGVRLLGPDAAPAEWTASADTISGAGISMLRMKVEAAAAARRRASEPLAPGERIDPNVAPVVELDRLPRVGPALAARIVEHRESRGAFATLGDLDLVSGIGPAMLESIAPHLSLPPGPARAAAASPAAGGAALTGGRLHVNRATAAELEALPGIGPSLASRIVEWRRENGPFTSLEALEQVSGIGPSLRERLAPLVSIDR